MLVGLTGSRKVPTGLQRAWLESYLKKHRPVLHHGACAGADEAAHFLALWLGLEVCIHPPVDRRAIMAAPLEGTLVFPARPYLERNRAIVDSTQLLIALPSGPERRRSGTWATVRYARAQSRQVIICWPDGVLEVE